MDSEASDSPGMAEGPGEDEIPKPHTAKAAGSPKKALRMEANSLSGIIGRYRTADFDRKGPWGVNDIMNVLEAMKDTAADLNGAYAKAGTEQKRKATEFSRKLSAFYDQQLDRAISNRVPSPDDLDAAQSFAEQAKSLTSPFQLDSTAGKAMMSMVLVLPALALLSAGFFSTPAGMVTDTASFNPSYITGFASGLIVCAVLLVISRIAKGKKI